MEACLGKKCYDALSAREAARINSRKFGRRWTAYPCKECPNWHIGHTIGRNPSRGSVRARLAHKAARELSWVGLEGCPAEIYNRLKCELK